MIFKVEKRRRRTEDGKLKVARFYSLRYRIGNMPADKWVSLGVTDKAVANSKANDFIRDKERELAGLPNPEKELVATIAPLAGLVAEYEAELATRGRDEKYVISTAKRLLSLAADCGWLVVRDVTADSFMTWRRSQGMKSKTLNDYLSDVRSFLQWLVELDRLASNPLSKVPRITVKDDEEEKRRAFAGDEAERLFLVSGSRAIIYQATLFCGLRRGELETLAWGDVQQDRNGATFLKIRASTTKNGKTTLQPVPEWLAESLRKYRPKDARLSDRVFPVVPRMPRFLKDLDAAGIPRVDERGHVSKFHSLRHSLGTWLWATGADPRVIMKLMRHSSLELTVSRYTDEAGLASNDAVNKLPIFDLTQIRAQISAVEGQNVSQAGETRGRKVTSQSLIDKGLSRLESGVVAVGRMVRAAGFESIRGCL